MVHICKVTAEQVFVAFMHKDILDTTTTTTTTTTTNIKI